MAARDTYASGPEPVLVTFHDDRGHAHGAYLRTPPFPALASGLPAQLAPPAVDALREIGEDPPRVHGPEPEAHALADAWCRSTGKVKKTAVEQRLYELDELVPPENVPGRTRTFADADVNWLASWRSAFGQEAMDHAVESDPSEEALRSFIEGGRWPVLWSVDDVPVAMAFTSTPVHGMSRIGHVYTQPEHRNRGYGSAVTAAACDVARAAGAQRVVLFTDLANPVSNAIYQRIGFRPVMDVAELALDGA
ncbi:GNAT family N-acetyltransferase [Halopolyspora algeriensis]|nr:GNAT family N-acetyltransferase [Halopolyspora algeriensis]